MGNKGAPRPEPQGHYGMWTFDSFTLYVVLVNTSTTLSCPALMARCVTE